MGHSFLWRKVTESKLIAAVLGLTGGGEPQSVRQVSHGLQLQSLWRIPAAAVSQHDMAYSCSPCGESLLQL